MKTRTLSSIMILLIITSLVTGILSFNIVYADTLEYRMVIFPSAGNTTIVFTNTSYYEIQYDSNYKHIIPDYKAVYEIVILNSLNETLNNYNVEIDLSSIDYIDWDVDINSIYFVDEYANPLYYWFEKYNSNLKIGRVWIKIPFLPANGNVTVYMFVGGSNPYSSYNDPEQVFYLFEDFEGSTTLTEEHYSNNNGYQGLTTTRAKYGQYSAWFHDPGSGDYDVKLMSSIPSLSPNEILYLSAWFYYAPSYTDKFNRFGFATDLDGGEWSRLTSYARTDDYYFLSKVVSASPSPNAWYKMVVYIKYTGSDYSIWGILYNEDGDIVFQRTKDNAYTVTGTLTKAGVVAVFGNEQTGDVYFDGFIITKLIDPEPNIVSAIRLGSTFGRNDQLDNSNGLMALMASRSKTFLGLVENGTEKVGVFYDCSGDSFKFRVGSDVYSLGDLGYENDYFLYIITGSPWYAKIVDIYDGSVIEYSSGNSNIYNIDSVNTTKYLFYVVTSGYNSEIAYIHIRAPPNYYVANVSVQDMFAYYQHSHIYIFFIGNDAWIELNYNDNTETYYPLVINIILELGDLPDRNTYDASQSLPPKSSSDESGSDSGTGSVDTSTNITFPPGNIGMVAYSSSTEFNGLIYGGDEFYYATRVVEGYISENNVTANYVYFDSYSSILIQYYSSHPGSGFYEYGDYIVLGYYLDNSSINFGRYKVDEYGALENITEIIGQIPYDGVYSRYAKLVFHRGIVSVLLYINGKWYNIGTNRTSLSIVSMMVFMDGRPDKIMLMRGDYIVFRGDHIVAVEINGVDAIGEAIHLFVGDNDPFDEDRSLGSIMITNIPAIYPINATVKLYVRGEDILSGGVPRPEIVGYNVSYNIVPNYNFSRVNQSGLSGFVVPFISDFAEYRDVVAVIIILLVILLANEVNAPFFGAMAVGLMVFFTGIGWLSISGTVLGLLILVVGLGFAIVRKRG